MKLETDFFYSEDEGNTFLLNVVTYPPISVEMMVGTVGQNLLNSRAIHFMEPISIALRHPKGARGSVVG
jgi:hypothetical protein